MRLTAHKLAICLCLLAGAAMAHRGVTNAAVKARMHVMGQIGQNTKLLGDMYKGAVDFNVPQARSAAKAIAKHAATVPALFAANETDPKSEALPVIWTQFDDFTSKSRALQAAADKAAATIRTRTDLRTALGQIGGACQSCHQTYRK